MAILLPFQGTRPRKDLVSQVAAPPYDVLNREEARLMALDNPLSFLHINKPEIDLPDTIDPHDPIVYATGAATLERFKQEGVFQKDEVPCYYVYRLTMELADEMTEGTCSTSRQHTQTGLVGLAPITEYVSGNIRKHELTRPDKENDRVSHMDALNAQTGPVLLTCKHTSAIEEVLNANSVADADFDFVGVDHVRHQLWKISEQSKIADISSTFSDVATLYVADGHHRSAAAQRVMEMRKQANSSHNGKEPYNFFLTVTFPDINMKVLDYNRVVRDLGQYTDSAFLEALSVVFDITPQKLAYRPARSGSFGLYMNHKWYELLLKPTIDIADQAIAKLDVSILQNFVLSPLLKIDDPRTDDRIDFVGGIRGLQALTEKVDSGEFAAAFACFPTTVTNLMEVADANVVMPPKSTWFEPKLLSGLVIHDLAF